jgi:predicted MFS family arabinose efflux permease
MEQPLQAGAARPWVAVLAATMLLQAVSAFLLRIAPTIAPYLTAEAGLSPDAIGHLSAVGTIGAIGFLLIGTPLIRRAGSIRILQWGAALAAAGVLLFTVPHPLAIFAAVFLIGVGYGPSPAAGSDILQRYAPARRRGLIFSIKQAGVPVGGVLAGLLLPPAIVHFGIWGAVGVSLAFSIIAVILVQPLRAEIDASRVATTPIGFGNLFSVQNIAEPFRAVTRTSAQLRLALTGMCYSFCQGVWFTFLVTYLVVKLDYSLALAGVVFAVTQLTGIVGRMVLGWVADVSGSGSTVLVGAGVASAVCSAMLAMTTPQWPLWSIMLLASVAGVAVSSWNGVQIAETVRLAPKNVHVAAAGSTAVVFTGYMIGPSLFALFLAATGRYDLGFLAIATVGLMGAALAWPRGTGLAPS